MEQGSAGLLPQAVTAPVGHLHQSQSSPAGSETWRETGSNCPCQGICLLKTELTPPLQSLELISPVCCPSVIWVGLEWLWGAHSAGQQRPHGQSSASAGLERLTVNVIPEERIGVTWGRRVSFARLPKLPAVCAPTVVPAPGVQRSRDQEGRGSAVPASSAGGAGQSPLRCVRG